MHRAFSCSVRALAVLLVLSLGFGAAGGAHAQTPVSRCPAVYQYNYEYNTPDLIENHYIVLESEPRGAQLWYYGTSDEFDDAREGYLPGFFVAQAQGTKILGDRLSFTLLRPSTLLKRPVPLAERRAIPGREGRWNETQLQLARRSYTGLITQDSIVLDATSPRRVFRRLPNAAVSRLGACVER